MPPPIPRSLKKFSTCTHPFLHNSIAQCYLPVLAFSTKPGLSGVQQMSCKESQRQKGGKEKESGEKKIEWPTHNRDALYLCDLTSRGSQASFRDFLHRSNLARWVPCLHLTSGNNEAQDKRRNISQVHWEAVTRDSGLGHPNCLAVLRPWV